MQAIPIEKCDYCCGSRVEAIDHSLKTWTPCHYCEESGIKEPLKLKNDGQLEIVFIGVGSAFAKRRRQTNFLIIKGDKHIMVDFGMTGPTALWQTTRLAPTDIETILPTHSHADHVGGIECIGLMNRYVGQRFMKKPKTKIIITSEYQRILWDQTLRGGMEWNEDLENHGKGRKLGFTDFFEVIRPKWKQGSPRESFEVDYGDIRIELFRTNHIPEQSSKWDDAFLSFGLFIDGHVFISSDTQFDQELFDYYGIHQKEGTNQIMVDKSSVMFQDVQFFPGAVHAPLEKLKTLRADIKAKMYLMHYADSFDKQDITGFAGWAQEGVRYIF